MTKEFKIGDSVQYEKWYYLPVNRWTGIIVDVKTVKSKQTGWIEKTKYRVRVEDVELIDRVPLEGWQKRQIQKKLNAKPQYRWVFSECLRLQSELIK